MKSKSKITIDVLMMIGMFLSISVDLLGTGGHKIAGLLTFILFIAHNALNFRWYKTIFKGKYSVSRFIHSATNIIVLLAMIGLMVSGIMLSKEMAGAVISHPMTFARMLHIGCTALGYGGVALHIGFHLKRRVEYAG